MNPSETREFVRNSCDGIFLHLGPHQYVPILFVSKETLALYSKLCKAGDENASRSLFLLDLSTKTTGQDFS